MAVNQATPYTFDLESDKIELFELYINININSNSYEKTIIINSLELHLTFRVLWLRFYCNKSDWGKEWFNATTSAVSLYMKRSVVRKSSGPLF